MKKLSDNGILPIQINPVLNWLATYARTKEDNKITKDVIEKETKLDKLPDAMKYYKKEKVKER